MRSRTTKDFRDCLQRLPQRVQHQAKDAFKLFQHDNSHPSLRFKRVHQTRPIYSARISINYRVVAVIHGDEILWFWAGSHADYGRLLVRMRAD